MFILLFGSGNMGTELYDVCAKQNINCEFYTKKGFTEMGAQPDTIASHKEQAVIVHLGSGKELQKAIEWSEEFNVPLIQGSTSQEHLVDKGILAYHDANIIMAPNLSLPIVRFMKAFPAFANAVKTDMEVDILESHQFGKKDTSGTARTIANDLNFPVENIVSIRDIPTQQALSVPMQHRGGHAYHHFMFSGLGVEIEVTTKVNGRRTYAMGALQVAEMVLEHKESLADFRDDTGTIPLTNIIHLMDK